MTTTNSLQGNTHPIHRDAATHLFLVGQIVRLKSGLGRNTLYRITGTLPPRGDSPQYRIRSVNEPHERVTTQESLEPARMTPTSEAANLLERTFGRGQGTETQQPRDH